MHGHAKIDCPYTRRTRRSAFGVPCQEAEKKFSEKLQRLKQNHPDEVVHCVIKYQCEFEKEKSNDPDVKHFMKHVYDDRTPDYRLEPRAAGMTLLNIIFCKRKFF